MPNWTVRATIELSAVIEADSADEAIAKAPAFPECEAPDWDTVEFGDYEAEEE